MEPLEEDDVVLQPEALEFTENDAEPQLISIENWSQVNVAFRIKASISNILMLGEAGGVIESSTAVEFPVSLKGMLPPDFEHTACIALVLLLEMAPHADEYENDGIRAFWASRSKTAVKKSVSCTVRKNGATSGSLAVDSSTDPHCVWLSQSQSLGTFEDDGPVVALPAKVDPPQLVHSASLPAPPPLGITSEIAVRPGKVSSGSSPHPKPFRRHSMLDVDVRGSGGMSFCDELKQRQQSGGLELKHVTTKTAAEKEEERLLALGNVPDGGFTSVIDELRHFSFILNQSMNVVSEISLADIQEEAAQQAVQHAEELAEKELRITELNAEINRLMVQYDDDCVGMQLENVAQVSALQQQYGERFAAQLAEHEAALSKASASETARVEALTYQYESRIAALMKQQEELGGQVGQLFQQQAAAMVEAAVQIKENESQAVIRQMELQYKAQIHKQDLHIAELKISLDRLKSDRDHEVGMISRSHSVRVQSLTSQQASTIGCLSSQLEATMRMQRDSLKSLTAQVADLQQQKADDAARLRQQYDAKLMEYTTFCTNATNEMENELIEIKDKLQRAESKLAAAGLADTTNCTEETTVQSVASEVAALPIQKELRLRDTLKTQITVRKLVPRNRPIPAKHKTTAAENIFIASNIIKFSTGSDSCEDRIILRNQGILPVAYKVFANKKNLFSISEASGVLLGGELKLLSVIKKATTQPLSIDDIESAKFKITLTPAGEDYLLLDAKEFWSKYKNQVVEKIIITEVLS